MEDFVLDKWGISYELFNYLVLPLLIFVARVGDVTLSTIRILFVMNGKRNIAPILGFFEALIWLIAIGQIISNVNNIWSYLAYSAGFATGTFVGMYLEEKLAVGRVVVRLILKEVSNELMTFLHTKNFRYSLLKGTGKTGEVSVVFFVVKRDALKKLLDGINKYHPKAFYTIEGVKQVNEANDFASDISPGFGYAWWQLKRR